MLRSRFFWKLYASFVLLILTALALLGTILDRRVSEDARAADLVGLRHQVELLRAYVGVALDRPPAELRQGVNELGAATESRLTVIAADGKVLADSAFDPAQLDDHGQRPEVRQALAGGVGEAERFSTTVEERLHYVALAIPDAAGAPRAVARGSLSIDRLEARRKPLRRAVLPAAGAAMVIGLILALFLARHTTDRVTRLTRLAESIASGEHDTAASESGPDELGQLGGALEAMSRQLEERLEIITEDRGRLLAILAAMVEGVVAIDAEERVVHMNREARRLLGAAETETVGRRIWEVSRLTRVSAILERARREERDVRDELVIRTEEGVAVEFELRAAPLRGADGAIAGAVLVLHDVSELRRLETVRRDFVANVSHELKTPLTSIRGFVETLIDDPEMDANTRARFLQRVRVQSDRLSALVSDLLTLARIESNERTTEPTRFDLRGPLRDSALRLRAAAEEKGLQFFAELGDEAVPLVGDEESVRQIADNLIANAIQYTPTGGRVTLSLTTADGRARIAVRDTGIGIEPREQERIFERFYRVDRARSRALGGTGLGLAIVKHLSLALGGTVDLESVPGRGSTFFVALPVHSPDPHP